MQKYVGISILVLCLIGDTSAAGTAPSSASSLAPLDRVLEYRVTLKDEGGAYVAPVLINGTITLNFTVDSGAADVSIPADVFSTLVRAGTIGQADITGYRTYLTATGAKSRAVTFIIRSLKVAGLTIQNVQGSVAPAQGMLLLGQSFLKRFTSWSIDNAKHQLVLTTDE